MKGSHASDAAITWRRRKSSMPTVPGGLDEQMDVLRRSLEYVAVHTPDREALMPWPSADKLAKVGEVANQLAPAGLVRRLSNHRIAVTEDAQRWLAEADDTFLISVMHHNVRFVGELLVELGPGGLAMSDLRRLANDKYQLGWTSLDQVHRRCAWLRATGMIELQFDQKVVRTARGSELLGVLDLATPDDIAYIEAESTVRAESLPIATSPVQNLLDSLDEQSLRARPTPSMYVAKGRGSALDTLTCIRMQLEVMAPDGTKEGFFDFCNATFNSKEASARAALDTLRNVGLIQQTGFGTYAATPAAKSWLESGEALDLIRIVHAHIRCVGELLPILHEPRSVAEVHSMIAQAHGVKLHDAALRLRMQLLRECDLVRQATASTYHTTSRGTAFAELMPLEQAQFADRDIISPAVTTAEQALQVELIDELRDAARDVRRPSRFEAAITTTLRALGLHATGMGGPGDTDVLVTIRTSPTTEAKVIVDAKATGNPSVLESAIDFDSLEEHRRRHKADHIALVGVGFAAGRVERRAAEKKIALITVDQLAEVVDRYQTSPLTPIELLALFDCERQGELWMAADQRSVLITAVIHAIAEEAEYIEQSDETFDARDIRKRLFRTMSSAPSQDDVMAVLDLLATPVVGGIVPDGKGKFRPGAPAEAIGTRLRAIANAAYAAEAE